MAGALGDTTTCGTSGVRTIATAMQLAWKGSNWDAVQETPPNTCVRPGLNRTDWVRCDYWNFPRKLRR